jgi:hypothetical protein
VGTDPSADSGATTEVGGTMPPVLPEWHQSAKSTSIPRGGQVLLVLPYNKNRVLVVQF